MKKELKLFVKEVQTVEQILRLQGGMTRKEISRAKFRPGGIRRNGVQCRVTEGVVPGDMIEVCLEEAGNVSDHLVETGIALPPLEILLEDEDLLVVNKPAGVVTHPVGGHYNDTLSNQVMEYYYEKGTKVRIRPVGRLDRETSGIVIFAKNQVAAARLQRQREEGIFQKTYLAVAEGELPVDGKWHIIDGFIGKDPENHLKMRVAEDEKEGREAITSYQVLYTCGEWSVVKLELMTGRTHQIRLHMASQGWPLLGDMLYGRKMQESRTMLHAWKCRLYHPFRGANITLTAPIPSDLAFYMKFIP